jgi:predicted N-acetyltransferase YhbS
MEFRALQAAELEAWFDHVSTVFTASREYFMKHWYNDPWRDLDGIRVAVDEGRIVSTVRVFIRRLYLHGEQVSVGGIGEVSTLPEYQRRGLATQLLRDAIRFMEEHGIVLSALQGSQRIYSIEGWERVPRYYARQQMRAKSDDAFHIRPADFDSEAERNQLASLHDAYSRRFNGAFVRDHPDYWRDWVRTESPHAWVAVQDDLISGYISISNHDDRLFVKEFLASDDTFALDRGKRVFEALIGTAIASVGFEVREVMFPATIADGFQAEIVEQYGSTMYRAILPSKLPPFNAPGDLLHRQPEARDEGIASHHIFWNTDGY